MEIKSISGISVGIFILAFFALRCTETAPIDHDSRQEFVLYLKTIDSVQDIIVEGNDVHVRIVIDSSDVGCDEEWNFRNLGFIIALSSNDQWRNYLDSNGYTLYLHRSVDYEHGDFQYLVSYSSAQIVDVHNQFPDVAQVSREINYITGNFSCAEFREMFLVLKTFEADTIFASADTCFSQLFSNCRSNRSSESCDDIKKLRSMCDEVVRDRTYPVCDSLIRHFLELDRIGSTKE